MRFSHKTTWAMVTLAFVLLSGCSSPKNQAERISSQIQEPGKSTVQQQDSQTDSQQNSNSSAAAFVGQSGSIVYKNTEFGFDFTLPESWNGYTIVESNWEGASIQTGKTTETGKTISIRHPLWTAQNPRQDIPVMVFSLDQWNSLQNGDFHIGAAPINPSELGRNSKYVFALPARYNYAFPTGYEEVETILKNNPLKGIDG